MFTFIFSGMRLSDTHNGYRVIKKSVLPKLKLTFNGMEHASEILELIGQQGICIRNIVWQEGKNFQIV